MPAESSAAWPNSRAIVPTAEESSPANTAKVVVGGQRAAVAARAESTGGGTESSAKGRDGTGTGSKEI